MSDLQRYILRRAGRQNRVYYTDVLVEYFKWQPSGRGQGNRTSISLFFQAFFE